VTAGHQVVRVVATTVRLGDDVVQSVSGLSAVAAGVAVAVEYVRCTASPTTCLREAAPCRARTALRVRLAGEDQQLGSTTASARCPAYPTMMLHLVAEIHI
jgi:hypothetical protein